MQNSVKMKNNTRTWQQAVLLVAVLLTAVCKIYVGMDKDESYVTVMGIRLFLGDKMFDTMWELHMTSALPAWLGTKLFYAVTGSLDGLVIFLRMLSVLLQFLTAWIFYRIFRKYTAQENAFLAAMVIAGFLPRATQNLEYGLLEMLFVILSSALLYDVVRQENETNAVCFGKLICAAVLFALAVLSYPTIIAAFPIYLGALFFLAKGKKAKYMIPVTFAGICACCAVLFLCFLFSYLSVPEFLENLNGILSDGTHAKDARIYSYGTQLFSVLKRSMLFLAVSVLCYLFTKKWVLQKKMILYYLLVIPVLVLIFSNVTGLRESGAIGMQVRYLIAAVCSLIFYILSEKKENVLFGLFLLPGFFIYIGVMFGSNMGIEENSSFLYLNLIGVVLLASEQCVCSTKLQYNIKRACVYCFVLGIFFTKGYFVRVNGTVPANITEHRVQSDSGILKGIYVYEQEAESYRKKEQEIKAYSDSEDTILYLGTEAACNTFTEGKFTSATCISTPVFNEEWVQYYENENHPAPTVIFLDKDMIKTADEFFQTPFGAFAAETYQLAEENAIDGEMFLIFKVQ